jgi:CBS domain-containing protein
MMTIATILAGKGRAVITTLGETPVVDVVRLLAEKRIGAVPVLGDAGEVRGILSERDVLYGMARDGAALLARRADAVMTAPAITVSADLGVLVALSLMTRRRIRHLPVVEGGALIGLVSIGDLVKARLDRVEAEVEAMRQYIQQG